MHIRKTLAFFVILLCGQLAYGQHQFAGAKSTHHIPLQKLEPGREEARNNAYILFTLATGNAKSLMDIRLHYRFNSRMFMPYSGRSLAEVNMGISGFSLTGDTYYRGFDLSDWLIPDLIDAEISFRLQSGRLLKQKISFSLTETQWPRAVALFEKNPGQQVQDIGLRVDQLAFSNEAATNFTGRITQINDYWASIHLIDSLLGHIERRQIADSEQMAELLLYWDLSRKVSLLSQESVRAFTGNEPNGKLNALYERLGRMQTRLSTLLNSSIDKSPTITSGSDDLVQLFVSFLAERRALSARVNFQDAELFYLAGRLMPDDALAAVFKKLNRKHNPVSFVERFYQQLIQQGDILHKDEDLARAYDYFEDALLLSRFFPELGPDPQLHDKLERVQEGLLNAYFRIAASAVEAGNEQLAREYQSKATAFMRDAWGSEQGLQAKTEHSLQPWVESHLRRLEALLQNRQLIEASRLMDGLNSYLAGVGYDQLDDSLAEALSQAYRRVYMHFVVQAEQLHQAGQHTEAATALQNAIDFRRFNMHFLEASTEALQLQREINEPVVDAVIDEGITAIQQGQADLALNSFMAAREQARRYELTYGYRLDSLTSVAAKPILLDHLRTAHLKIWANELDSAWVIYADADMLRDRFLLNADPDIQKAFGELDRRFIERICLNHQLAFNELIEKIERAERQGRIMDIFPLVREARPIPANNPGCGIDDTALQAITAHYGDFFAYQQQYEHVLELLYEHGFAAAIESYLRLDEQVNKYGLEKYGFSHTSLDEFVSGQSGTNMLIVALQQFIALELPEKSLEYLHKLAEAGYDERSAREFQSETAAMLARRDQQNGWVNSADDRALDYVGNDNWFRYFRRTYARTINQLQRGI